jgi:hypothetical protein
MTLFKDIPIGGAFIDTENGDRWIKVRETYDDDHHNAELLNGDGYESFNPDEEVEV